MNGIFEHWLDVFFAPCPSEAARLSWFKLLNQFEPPTRCSQWPKQGLARWQGVWPFLRAMKDAKNTDRCFGDCIGRDVRRAVNDQFAAPAILPTRPLAGKSINRRTAATIRSSTRMAADGFSDSMYVKMASRSDNANADQVSFTIFAHPR